MSAIITFTAIARTETGGKAAAKLRVAGKVPVTVSRPGKPSTLLSFDTKNAVQFDRKVVHLAKLDFGSSPITVLRSVIARDVLKDTITHIDVIEVDEKATIKVDVAVVVDARNCDGVKAGGIVEQRMRMVKVQCPANAIPDSIEIRIDNVQLMQTILAERLVLPKGVKLVTPAKNPLLSVVIPRGMAKVDDAAVVAGAEGAAAPAAGAPAAAGAKGAAAPAAAAGAKGAAAAPAKGAAAPAKDAGKKK